ncbi:hypothetical protein BGZ60DRAFT_459059 [Tricladium varicosporioides]|nr:hypothetical protein BGZ60DRAFT_459059 [Hymenoscyphus varicosporioides]
MAPRIFILGISGYIGGQVLHDITKKHPEYQIRGLVRTDEQRKKIAAKYPSVQIIIGDLDSVDVLKGEAVQADIVLQLADADHTQLITTLLPSLPKTAIYIQLSGGASISTASNGVGQRTSKVWSDITDLSEIINFDHSHWHAVTDQLVLSEGKKQGIRTAVVAPPGVYGTGQGEIKRTSMVLPWYVDAVKKRGRGFTVGEGRNVNSVIHVCDLATALILLVEEAFEGSGKADWGEKGWYFVEGGECAFIDVAKATVKEMAKRGMISGEELDVLTAEEAKELHPYAELLWGSNMRVNGERIRSLGWRANKGDIFSTIPELLAE